jgi:pyridoxine kinase
MCNKSLLEAIEFAGTFVRDAMIITREQPDFEVRGVSFEGVLKELTNLL